jgi:hypothetical protein
VLASVAALTQVIVPAEWTIVTSDETDEKLSLNEVGTIKGIDDVGAMLVGTDIMVNDIGVCFGGAAIPWNVFDALPPGQSWARID